jgi:hypothetical protein
MISLYSLRFSSQDGIVAQADEGLFDNFSGPAMKEGDIWKLYLGSRVELDPDDHDGSEFIEGLLEDAMMVEPKLPGWKTERSPLGVWETRPCEELFTALTVLEVPLDKDEDLVDEEEGTTGDGGEWDCDQDCLGVTKAWAPEGCILDPASGEAVIVNKYYDTDDDYEDNEIEPGADIEAMDEAEDDGGEADPVEDDADMTLDDDGEGEEGDEDGFSESTDSDGDLAGTDWSEEELSGDDVDMLKEESRSLIASSKFIRI